MSEINMIINILNKDKLISFAYLFGSRAMQKASERSDWDIAVYIKDEYLEENPIWQKFKIEDKLSSALKTDAVEVVILNYMDNPLLGYEIINRGSLIVDKDTQTRIKFEADTLGRYQDWQYFAKRYISANGSRRL